MRSELTVTEASVLYGAALLSVPGKPALAGLNLKVGGENSRIVAVVGESGSGKTTLARLLLGLLHPSSGTVALDGKLLAELRPDERRVYRRKVQAVLQDPYDTFNPYYPVDHALSVPLASLMGIASRSRRLEQIGGALEAVGLRPDDVLGKYPHEISGGQRQRIMIARALLLEPDILIADEPVSMVDASMRATILEMIYKLNKRSGTAVVFITHDLMTAYQVADETIVLYGGKVVERGPTEEILYHPLHPYTQELIDAIPSTNPSESWNLRGEDRPSPQAAAITTLGIGVAEHCVYLHKCKIATNRCRASQVPETSIGQGRSLACIERARKPAMVGEFHPAIPGQRSHQP